MLSNELLIGQMIVKRWRQRKHVSVSQRRQEFNINAPGPDAHGSYREPKTTLDWTIGLICVYVVVLLSRLSTYLVEHTLNVP